MDDPYEALGVGRDADATEIRRAYQKRARAAHPDRPGGDKEAFQRVNSAYMLLSDDGKRARYDRTGDVGQTDAQAQMMGELAGLILSIIDATDADTFEVLNAARARIQEEVQKIRTEMDGARKLATKREQDRAHE